MYDFSDYRWKDIPPMKTPRVGATSSLTPDGDLWILGGTFSNPLLGGFWSFLRSFCRFSAAIWAAFLRSL